MSEKIVGLAERIDRVLEERLPDLDIETGKAIHDAITKNADDRWKELKLFVENFPLDSDFDRENSEEYLKRRRRP